MNNSCPSCGAIYNVAGKDVGRRIKCKKCGTALIVTDAGLEVDDPDAPPPPRPTRADDFDDDRAEDAPRKGRGRRSAGLSLNPLDLLAKIGGVSTILFGFGIFLVVFTGFQDAIGKAKIERRQAAIDEGQMDYDSAKQKIEDNKDLKESDRTDRLDKLKKEWDKERKQLEEAKKASDSANKKSGYIDKYVLMFGFLLIAFGCIGYLQANHAMLLRIVAAIILVSMVLALFKAAAGAGAGIGAAVGVG